MKRSEVMKRRKKCHFRASPARKEPNDPSPSNQAIAPSCASAGCGCGLLTLTSLACPLSSFFFNSQWQRFKVFFIRSPTASNGAIDKVVLVALQDLRRSSNGSCYVCYQYTSPVDAHTGELGCLGECMNER